MTNKTGTPEKQHSKDQRAICNQEFDIMEDVLTVTCDLPKGHSGEHKSLEYRDNIDGTITRIAIGWEIINEKK